MWNQLSRSQGAAHSIAEVSIQLSQEENVSPAIARAAQGIACQGCLRDGSSFMFRLV